MIRLIGCLFITFVSACVQASITPWISFELDNGHIKVPVTVAGKQSMAILDTGAQLNAINQNFIDFHQLNLAHHGNVQIEGAHDTERRKQYSNVDVEVFGIKTKLNQLAAVNMGNPQNSLLIGAGFFSQFVVQIDYPNSRIRMVTRDVINVAKHENIKTQPHKGSGLPIVQVEMAGKKVWLLLDTGSNSGVLINRRLAKGLDLIRPEDHQVVSRGANAQSTLRTTQLEELTFGPFVLSNVQLAYPEKGHKLSPLKQYAHTSSMIKGKRVKGILGYDVLKHFLVTLDYARGNMHLSVPEKL
ncbi:pepsin/retropepsin-like aspartic protease family protein [Pseudoalteromonas ardens]|uniref:pepsin/retropepsin-like aspartic protease family protein n=1 Tax=Pseudoalteromonas ardens TaxID=3048490 RepID=UPI0024C2F43C|nr:pepsin/retropepsin-like aspartic protease family protein [Pseudoalteromonas sp. R96]MDK1313833.1 pepsin/retropepsin-like aspartic protease family protein [Pseudoalteromonas sp. R96]